MESHENLFRHGNDFSDRFFNNYLEKFHKGLGGSKFEHKKREEGQYPCINLSQSRFLEYLSIAMKEKRKQDHDIVSFVDAGCGIGHKLLLANFCGIYKITGIDCTKEYLEEAKNLCSMLSIYDKFNLLCEDIIKVDYSSYDIIYFYVPLCSHEKEKQFEERVAATAKKGSIIIGVGAHGIEKLPGIKRIISGLPVYKKVPIIPKENIKNKAI